MPVETAPAKVRVEDFAHTVRDQFVPLNPQFSYFCAPPMADDDLRQYLHEPISALPPAICAVLPGVTVTLAPYLEKTNQKGGVRISFERVPESSQLPSYRLAPADRVALFFAVKEEEISDYHYSLYNEIAAFVSRHWSHDVRDTFSAVVRAELTAKVHGEVDDKSWRLKQAIVRKPAGKDAKAFKEYVRQAFEDTLTLYLHGICCDIDVEAGPRQMPSRQIRKRLEALYALFPPPAGHAVFPEELKRR
jgi:hypothetical protein